MELNLETTSSLNKTDLVFFLTEAYYNVCEDILEKEKFNCDLSGCTSTQVLIYEDTLICLNCGDSRSIVSFYDESAERW
jgi:serine/threonine protein phosphatase PrpC